MKIGVNYYTEVEELIRDKELAVDYMKFPSLGWQCEIWKDETLSTYRDWVREKNKICPVMIHGLGPVFDQIGSIHFKEWMDVKRAKETIANAGVNGISLHLCGTDPKFLREKNKQIILENIRYLKEQFPYVSYLSLENVDGNPYLNKDRFGICIEPDFIKEVIEESEVEFLFDISHAYGSAKSIKMDFYEYIDRLPLDKIYEIHINGWIDNGTDIMAHTRTTKEAYEALEYVLHKSNPKLLTLEYGRSGDRMNTGMPLVSSKGSNPRVKQEIKEQMIELKEWIK